MYQCHFSLLFNYDICSEIYVNPKTSKTIFYNELKVMTPISKTI